MILLNVRAKGVHQRLDLLTREVAFLKKVTFRLKVIPAPLPKDMRLDFVVELHAFPTLILLFDLLASLGFQGRFGRLRLLGVRFLLLSCGFFFCFSLGLGKFNAEFF